MTFDLSSTYNRPTDEIFNSTLKKYTSCPWDDPRFYSQWLAQTYFMVSHTPRFICLAASRFSIESDRQHREMIDHIGDEDKHEYLLLSDLKNLGWEFNTFTELPSTTSIIHTLYHTIDHVHPASIFGRILFLEAMAVSMPKTFFETIFRTYSQEATKFLRVHGEEDIEHLDKAMERIKKSSTEEAIAIGNSFYLTGYLYRQFLDGIVESASTNSNKLAV